MSYAITQLCRAGLEGALLEFCCHGRSRLRRAAGDRPVPEQSGERVQREEERGSWASRCFSFWVLARKGQLRAALNEAGSHPINCLVQ